MDTITPQNINNRSLNLLAISIAGLAGFAFLPEAFLEKDIPDKVDDIALFIIALIGMFWYTRSNNRYIRSVTPIIIVMIAMMVKIVGVMIEHADTVSVGDDFGGLILFILATILVVYQYLKDRTPANVTS
jgi:peptidoglycan/LPS O-acetylase OafA/YrhL